MLRSMGSLGVISSDISHAFYEKEGEEITHLILRTQEARKTQLVVSQSLTVGVAK